MRKIMLRLTVPVLAVGLTVGLGGCEDLLEPEVYGSLTPQTFFQSESDFLSAVVALYAPFSTDWGHVDQGSGGWYNNLYNHNPNTYWALSELTGDGLFGWWSTTWDNFTWGLTVGTVTYTKIRYVARATDIIDKIENSDADIRPEIRARYGAEARALRAWLMHVLYDFYGPVNVKLDPATLYDNEITPRLSHDEYVSAMISDLNTAIPNLPDRVTGDDWGRIDKGTARMVLLRIHMMEKDWAAAEAVARDIMGMGYSLVEEYEDVCNVEQNPEMIYAVPADGALSPNWYWMEIVPSNFESAGDITYPGGWYGIGMPWDFYDTMYSPGDERLETLVAEYSARWGGGTVNRDNGLRGAIPFKCTQNLGPASGSSQDWPVFRYAETLLSLAEAINEQAGPTAEALGYANMVRERSELEPWSGLTQDEFRDSLLAERGREFYSEGLRRQDLIRHGKFIEYALADGAEAEPHEVLFPIPQSVINEGEGVVIQNCGYENAAGDCYPYDTR
jgi:hypothetical protein